VAAVNRGRVRYSLTVALSVVASLMLGGTSAGVLARGAGQTVTTKSVWSGVYTADQAAAGEKIYFAQCASCHGDDLAGREPALAGAQFLEGWHGKTLRRMLERIEEMPPGAPVSATDGVSVLAFLLYSSEMPAGPAALPADRARLADITFERTKP
jgi:mono/diheme cytochrome c family protein